MTTTSAFTAEELALIAEVRARQQIISAVVAEGRLADFARMANRARAFIDNHPLPVADWTDADVIALGMAAGHDARALALVRGDTPFRVTELDSRLTAETGAEGGG